MLYLVEDLKINMVVYVVVETIKDFIYAEYIVVGNEYQGLRNTKVTLNLTEAFKKIRYFKHKIDIDGFIISHASKNTKYKIYDDLNHAKKDFCKMLKDTNKNPKLEKKLRNKHPSYFL
jgi:hypothetical protein